MGQKKEYKGSQAKIAVIRNICLDFKSNPKYMQVNKV